MGQKTVRFSDLSDQLIADDDEPARIVVLEHPGLTSGPVEIEALADEARGIEKAALPVAVVDLYLPGESEPQRITMEAGAFDALATGRPMSDVLESAPPARRTVRAAATSSTRAERSDYSTLEHAGKPHKGKITEAERQLVREHFDEINQRLATQGLRTISLADPDHIERYDLAALAAERKAEAAG